uniref:RING-type domain-containing protein n=1 Tax=Neobodo designis TaxID=312471 RepID=A0A7S1M1D7_NEODS|mmetsp:Transcript_32344/g.100069  ORF Transcript_32344/g.100069 Transcript_32344/m.100069 type:complete len:227 (+) Transcript_32344:26-706(+)
MIARFAIFLSIFASCAPLLVADGIRCTNGAFQHDCPNTSPVCCFAEDGTPAGCCGADYVCNSKGGCKRAPPPPTNATAAVERDVEEDVHTTVIRLVEAAAVMVGALLLVLISVFVGLTLKRISVEQRQRQALLDAMPTSSDSDDDVSSDTEARLDAENAAERTGSASEPASDSRLRKCAKCGVNGVSCMHLPCEHAVCCVQCAARTKRCPECKQLIRKRKKLFVVV